MPPGPVPDGSRRPLPSRAITGDATAPADSTTDRPRETRNMHGGARNTYLPLAPVPRARVRGPKIENAETLQDNFREGGD